MILKGYPWVFLVLLGLTGCHPKSSTQQLSEDVIRIGEVGSMTGSDATFGISTHRGIDLAVQDANQRGGVRGKQLKLLTLDDEGKASEAVLAVSKLIHQNKVHGILGEVASTLSIAMAPVAQQYKIPMISPSSINFKLTQEGNYIFRVCYLDRFQSQTMANFARKNLHAKRVAILRDIRSDYSRDSADLFSEYFKKQGGEIVIDQSYSAGDIDFKSQLTAIRAASPDLILVPGYYTEIGLVARQSKELSIQAPLLGGDGWDSPKLKEIGGPALEGSYFVSHFSQENPASEVQNFILRYKSTYGVIPDGLAALGYDAGRVMIEALRKSPSLNSEDVRKTIASTRDFPGVTGSISINSDRNAVKPAYVFKIAAGGNFKLVQTLHE